MPTPYQQRLQRATLGNLANAYLAAGVDSSIQKSVFRTAVLAVLVTGGIWSLYKCAESSSYSP